MPRPTIGRIILYRTDGRNGLVYDLPAIINCTKETHPGDYPDGSQNPLPVPESDDHVHLTVFTPGGFGTTVQVPMGSNTEAVWENKPTDEDFVGATSITPGSGTYVEWNVPFSQEPKPRTWRWPVYA